jgi:hypothetical protein
MYFNGDFEVTLIGDNFPLWLRGVRLIKETGSLKVALKKAAKLYPAGFFWWYDDCCLLVEQTPEQLMRTPARASIRTPDSTWGRWLQQIADRLKVEGLPTIDYSLPHGPYWYDADMVREAFADFPKEMRGKFPFETWILNKKSWPYRLNITHNTFGKFSVPGPDKVFWNYADSCTKSKEWETWATLKFCKASRFERNKRKAKIKTPRVQVKSSPWLAAPEPFPDVGVAAAMASVFAGVVTAIDIGCGVQIYAKALRAAGVAVIAKNYNPHVSDSSAQPAAITDKVEIKAELVTAIDTGKHIPEEYVSKFFDLLAETSSRFVVLSWDCSAHQYMDDRGFSHAAELEKNIRNAANLRRLKNSIIVFERTCES